MDFGAIDPGLARALLGDAPAARAARAQPPAARARAFAAPDPRPVAALVCALAALMAALPWA